MHGRLAVHHGLMNSEQTQQCLDEAQRLGIPMLRVALQRGLLSAEQAQSLESLSRTDAGPTPTPLSITPGSTRASGRRLSLPEAGEAIGEYQILKKLGQGGMGVVYLAERAASDGSRRLFAIKLITRMSDTALKRFQREAESAAAVDSHSHIVTIHKFSQHGPWPYLVLDYIDGQSLAQKLKQCGGRLELNAAMVIAQKMASALQAIHDKGLIHRDFKPGNVLIRSDGEAFLTDFGLVKDLEAESLSKTTDRLGTPHYMSPQQLTESSRTLGPAVDIWALGVVLYEMCTGQRPFQADSNTELTAQILVADPTAPRALNASIPRDAETVILKALAKSPEQRYSSASAMAEDCRRVVECETISASRMNVVTGLNDRIRRRYGKGALLALWVFFASVASFVLYLPFYLNTGRQAQIWSQRTQERALVVKDKLEIAQAEIFATVLDRAPPALTQSLWPVPAADAHAASSSPKSKPPEINSEPWQAFIQCKSEWSQLLAVEKQAEEAGYGHAARAAIPKKTWRQWQRQVAFLQALDRVTQQRVMDDGKSKLLSEDMKAFLRQWAGLAENTEGVDWAAIDSSNSELLACSRLGQAFAAVRQGHFEEAAGHFRSLDVTKRHASLKAFAERCDDEACVALLLSSKSRFSVLKQSMASWLNRYGARPKRLIELNRVLTRRFAESMAGLSVEQQKPVWSVLKGRLKSFPSFKEPRLPRALCESLATELRKQDQLLEAYRYYLRIVQYDKSFRFPKSFQLNDVARHLFSRLQEHHNHEEIFQFIRESERAGVFLWMLDDDWLQILAKKEVFQKILANSPKDHCVRYWRAVASLDDDMALSKGERLKLLNRSILDLKEVIKVPGLNASYLAQSQTLLATAYVRYARVKQQKNDQRDICIGLLEAAMKGLHPRPDKVYERLLDNFGEQMPAKEVVRYCDLWAQEIENAFQRTLARELEKDRPVGNPLMPVFRAKHRERMGKALTRKALALYVLEQKEEALKILNRAFQIDPIKCPKHSAALAVSIHHDLGRDKEARRVFEKYREQMNPDHKRVWIKIFKDKEQ